jgi:L-asparaginase II
MSEKLVEIMRGSLVESIQRGDLAIVDYTGRLLYSAGHPREKVTFIRSASKPIQAIPVVTSGAADHYQFTDRELAIFCASHNAEQIHVDTIRGILKKIGLDESALQCGRHLPLDKEAANQLLKDGLEPTEVHSNCSGKHSGMLALAQHMGWDTTNYLNVDHPVQKAMRQSVASFAGMKTDEIVLGTDGCGVPVFGLPVYNMALAWARLAKPEILGDEKANAAHRITKAMTAYPMLVAGTGRLCTGLMTHLNGRLVAKSGAEGVYCAAILEQGIGLALKMEDGNGRADGPVIIDALRQMGFLSEADLNNLQSFHKPTIYNHRGDVVGESHATYTLKKH